ncbi:HNH endonuclease [Sandarakinorhabdus cyanobacteriorum]|nr:HNH endonuclease [Sandarakinorhabdus cyanobacteriorum]
MHRADSVYDDKPAERYQFPRQYLSRASQFVGDWIIYLEPTKVPRSRGYFAVAKVEAIVPDPAVPSRYLALIEPGSYLEFPNPVPFSGPAGVIEKGVLNAQGRNSGRAQSAVRPISPQDFNAILSLGLDDDTPLLPRIGSEPVATVLDEPRSRIARLSSRIVRDRVFRKLVLRAYDERCAVTGLKLINGGGRAEVEAAHIRPVEFNGPDDVRNGIALSGTVHWMFDRGLISLQDDLEIMISRQANDVSSIRALINTTGRARLPAKAHQHPHPLFLQWHRENCFKA